MSDDNIIDFEKAKTIEEKTALLLKHCDDFEHGFQLMAKGLEEMRILFQTMANEMNNSQKQKVADMEERLIKSVVDALKNEDK